LGVCTNCLVGCLSSVHISVVFCFYDIVQEELLSTIVSTTETAGGRVLMFSQSGAAAALSAMSAAIIGVYAFYLFDFEMPYASSCF